MIIVEALCLTWSVFQQYEAPDYTQEGVEEFYKSIHDEKYLSELCWYGAFIQKNLVGVIATRNAGTHIALFFVQGRYHRQGIGKQLVLKFPATSEINHPELEPELCAFLRKNGIPAGDFVKNRAGSCISLDRSGRMFTLQRHLPRQTLEWNSATETVLLESAELLGKIHSVLRNYPVLPEGIGAGFFAHMTPQRALTSYRSSLATAIRRGDSEIADELEWRIGLMERFPAWTFDLNRLTLCNAHGDYFILF